MSAVDLAVSGIRVPGLGGFSGKAVGVVRPLASGEKQGRGGRWSQRDVTGCW